MNKTFAKRKKRRVRSRDNPSIFVPFLVTHFLSCSNQVVTFIYLCHTRCRIYCRRNTNRLGHPTSESEASRKSCRAKTSLSKSIGQRRGDVKSGIARFSHGDHQPVRPLLHRVIPAAVSPEGQWKAVRMRDKGD